MPATAADAAAIVGELARPTSGFKRFLAVVGVKVRRMASRVRARARGRVCVCVCVHVFMLARTHTSAGGRVL